jgi:protein-tyrosine phosphatase
MPLRTRDFSETGKLPEQRIEKVLFLCTGNYYRSRFAEIFFNWHAERLELAWRAESRGLRLEALNSGQMSEYTVARLTNSGIPLDEYLRFPLDLNVADLKQADRIVAVKETEHRPLMKKRFPDWIEKVEFWEVHDIDFSDPADALPHLEREVLDLLQRLGNSKIAG